MKRLRRQASLRLTPYAWAKLLRLRDLGPTEVGGFGISTVNDLLLIEDVCLLPQRCTQVTVRFDDDAVADFFDEQVDRGLVPERFARIWIHTHPGHSPWPSTTDEETFARCFGQADWALMFILARGGRTYARLRFQAGPGGSLVLPVRVDFTQAFPAADPNAWEEAYKTRVIEEDPFSGQAQRSGLLYRLANLSRPNLNSVVPDHWWDDPYERSRIHHPLAETLDDNFHEPL